MIKTKSILAVVALIASASVSFAGGMNQPVTEPEPTVVAATPKSGASGGVIAAVVLLALLGAAAGGSSSGTN